MTKTYNHTPKGTKLIGTYDEEDKFCRECGTQFDRTKDEKDTENISLEQV